MRFSHCFYLSSFSLSKKGCASRSMNVDLLWRLYYTVCIVCLFLFALLLSYESQWQCKIKKWHKSHRKLCCCFHIKITVIYRKEKCFLKAMFLSFSLLLSWSLILFLDPCWAEAAPEPHKGTIDEEMGVKQASLLLS